MHPVASPAVSSTGVVLWTPCRCGWLQLGILSICLQFMLDDFRLPVDWLIPFCMNTNPRHCVHDPRNVRHTMGDYVLSLLSLGLL